MSVSVGFGRGIYFNVSSISVEYIAHTSMSVSWQTFLDEIDSCVGGYSAFSTINVKCWWWFLLYIFFLNSVKIYDFGQMRVCTVVVENV